jgi:hypothetical protein
MEITIEEAEKFLKEKKEQHLKDAALALEEWIKKYNVTLDVEISYSPSTGFQKRFVILDINN